ncbi:hypothetical protein [Sphingobium lignivorans]|uniref:Uncharacterized protein n=1 Tax=Sphingobium lignivorans TaxID=2735886 RepID=A0ABR6NAD5_9SPHN|nr:hypothetical protein [Sphingobium lignivorans]MBB5984243.1 hypothetical protein [Sphingobium lignivorans]
MAIIGQSGTDMRNERHYVVGAITAFLNRTGSGQDWDDFTASPLRDVELDRIRQCAGAIDLPLDAEGEAALRALLQQADLVSVYDGPVPWRLSVGAFAGSCWAPSFGGSTIFPARGSFTISICWWFRRHWVLSSWPCATAG